VFFCLVNAEDNAHLFFSCDFSKTVWHAVSTCVGKSLPVGEVGWNHFMLFGDLFKVKDDGRVRNLIWLATTWNIEII
jgi:hypothetical protein